MLDCKQAILRLVNFGNMYTISSPSPRCPDSDVVCSLIPPLSNLNQQCFIFTSRNYVMPVLELSIEFMKKANEYNSWNHHWIKVSVFGVLLVRISPHTNTSHAVYLLKIFTS